VATPWALGRALEVRKEDALRPTLSRLVLVGLALASPAPIPARGDGPTDPNAASNRETPGLRSTQVTIAIEKDGKRRQFRATVMARKDQSLTVLTAAHCISPADEGGPALLIIGVEVLEGKVTSVVRNPSYKENQPREIPGPDNAVVRVRFKPANKTAVEAFESLKPAVGLTARSYPGPSGKIVTVRMIDGHGAEHILKAGNYSNPRYLEWGPAYRPIPGDSGGGVFVLSGGPDGQPRPILIGIIVGRDDNGGMASLVSKEMRWIADELDK
jgi:hypothetical protein